MTGKEIRERKAAIEQRIADMLMAFQSDTGLTITEASLEYLHTSDHSELSVQLKMEVE